MPLHSVRTSQTRMSMPPDTERKTGAGRGVHTERGPSVQPLRVRQRRCRGGGYLLASSAPGGGLLVPFWIANRRFRPRMYIVPCDITGVP
jgi:hypothetical protein